jgi:hypothetical protein
MPQKFKHCFIMIFGCRPLGRLKLFLFVCWLTLWVATWHKPLCYHSLCLTNNNPWIKSWWNFNPCNSPSLSTDIPQCKSKIKAFKVHLHLETNGQRHLKYEPTMAVPSHYSDWSLDFLVVDNFRAVFVFLLVSSQVVVIFYCFAFTSGG